MKKTKSYLNLFQGIKLPWMLLLILFLTSIVAGKVEVRSVQITADIIDSYQNTIRADRLLRYLAYLAAIVACGVSTTWIGEICYGRINRDVRKKVFAHMLRLPKKFYDRESADELVSRIIVDAGSSAYYFEILISTFGAVYTAILVFKNLIRYNRVMGLYSLLIIPVSMGVAVLYGWFTYISARKGVNSNAVTMGYLFERTSAFRMIKAFNMQKAELSSGDKMFGKMFEADMFTEMTLAFVQVAMQIIGAISIVISFVFGSQMVKKGVLTIGELVAFYTLSGSVGVQLINLFLNYGSFRSITGSVKNVVEILALEGESTEGIEVPDTDADITVKNISFAYEDIRVLKNVTFTIPHNKTTAIIGTNGAGKSTMFKLLERIYEPTEGEICFGDTNIKEYSLPSWRDRFSIVAQGNEIISSTIRENMCYGIDEVVTDEQLMDVAEKCGIADFVNSLEAGLDAQISFDAGNISGGQRQMITIARAILKNSPYLLLDEATKSLDAESESLVVNALKELMQGRTTVMIAHNPSAVIHADQIIVMRDGVVEDIGTPEELIKRNSYYRIFMGETK